MPTALLAFVQGPNSAPAGQAVAGTLVHGAVTVSNGDDTGVVSWKFEILYVPPGSALVPPIVQGPGVTATFMFTPDVAGSYRLRLTVTDAQAVQDVDIRNFCVPFAAEGLIAPPYQRNPSPLPLTGVGAKPDEMNISGQPFGWDGDDVTSRKLLFQALKFLDGIVTTGEANTASNTGGEPGDIGVFKQKTGVDLEFKNIAAQSDGIAVSGAASLITIDSTTTGANVGSGTGLIFRDVAGGATRTLNFKSLIQGTGVTITNNADDITIAATGTGEVNLGANVGAGTAEVFRDKTSVTLNFRELAGVNGLSVVESTDIINIGAITGDRTYSNNKLTNLKTATFNSHIDDGNSGAAITIDFDTGASHKVTLTDNATLTIDPPVGPAHGLVLFVIQDATGGRDPTFSANVKWSQNGLKPTFSTDPSAIDILHFVYDGTNMYGFFAGDFA